ncbi:Ldh family oxidoreductase [Gulosibacter hominis]|uniref:Ldh family oxidoreductase n=1 Tax=Gulosibacter hominis TaxID=2770504 RepID=UPI001919D4A7|nr:Ldh family oxidoreductase [Gulosibacter hominis]
MLVTVQETTELLVKLFCQSGLSRDRAKKSAHTLVVAEVWGIGSHGLLRMPVYLDRLEAGGFAPDANLEVQSDTGPLVVLSGDGGLGLWQAHDAAILAVERAGQFGIGLAAVRDSGHCGALGVFAAEIAERGCVGVLMSSGPAVMPPWGGRQRLLSTSPIAAAFPAPNAPALIDLSLSTVARGKIAALARSGKELPEGWALDTSGKPTTDPVEALSGMLAPLGGAKGFALAYMVESITAGLFGPSLSSEVTDFFAEDSYAKPQGIAHVVLALDPKIFDVSNKVPASARLDDLGCRTVEAGGRVPGSRRKPLARIVASDTFEIDDRLWSELQSRLRNSY